MIRRSHANVSGIGLKALMLAYVLSHELIRWVHLGEPLIRVCFKLLFFFFKEV